MDIICIRGNGDRSGDDLYEPLLSDVNAGLERGRVELDEGALSDEVSLETILLDQRLGQTIEVDDRSIGRFYGKVTSLSHSVTIDDAGNLSGSSTFTLRKPR
jgi:hypothetical protein